MKGFFSRRAVRLAMGLAIILPLVLVGSTRSALGASGQTTAFRVAVLTPGTGNDGSWGQAVSEGVQAAQRAYRVRVTLVDNLNTPDQYQQQASAFASRHFGLVIIANGSDPTVAVKVAKQFPNVKFCETGVLIPNKPKNLCTTYLLFQNGDFLAGAVAGMVTRTNHVGVIGGFNFPVLNSEMEGFVLGARWINHRATVTETFINSWTDVAAARTAAQAQIGGGADVIFSATDQATEGIYSAAEVHSHTYVISQYFDTHSQAPKVSLTSVLYNLQGATQRNIQLGVEGKLKNKNYVFGPKQGVGKLAPFYQLKSVIPHRDLSRIRKISHWILIGKLKAPFLGVSGTAAKYNLKKLPVPPR